jgi:hypothetical protein
MSWGYDKQTGLTLPAGTRPSSVPGSRANVAQLVKDEIKQLLIDATTPTDRVFHAEIVAAGSFTWRRAFAKQFGAFYQGNRSQADHLADVCFTFIAKKWAQMYPDMSAQAFLDAVHVPSPLSEKETEKEINDAWELEIGGTEAGMRQHYDGSARIRKGADLGHKTTNVGKID